MRTKGQVAVEFLMYAGLFMLIVIGAYIVTTFTEVGEVSYRQSQLIESFGYTFGSAPTVAYRGGTNFTYDITIPKQLNGEPYNVTYVCDDESAGSTVIRECYVQVAWKGSYQTYIYPYVIAPAYYTKGLDQDCMEELSGISVSSATTFYSEKSNGHLYFKNIGFADEDDIYPTIKLYCEVEP